MKLKKDKNECSVLIEVPNELPTIELTPEDIFTNEKVVIDNTTYIWVDGYKGVDKDMRAYGGFQYEFNTSYVLNEIPNICQNGYHFCVNLEDVFEFYKFASSNRYFKVRALVNKEEYESYGETKLTKHYISYHSHQNMRVVAHPCPQQRGEQVDNIGTYYVEKTTINKLSAKVIILTEEITKETYFDYPAFVNILSKYWIDSEEELLSIKTFSEKGLVEFLNNKFITRNFKYYTPDFIKLYIQKYCNCKSLLERGTKFAHFSKVIETCYNNGLTKDATTAILLDEKL